MGEVSSRKAAWETRRAKYGARGHGGSYRRFKAQPNRLGVRALSLVIRLYREATLSEGQCCKALNMDRVDFRNMADGWDDAALQSQAGETP